MTNDITPITEAQRLAQARSYIRKNALTYCHIFATVTEQTRIVLTQAQRQELLTVYKTYVDLTNEINTDIHSSGIKEVIYNTLEVTEQKRRAFGTKLDRIVIANKATIQGNILMKQLRPYIQKLAEMKDEFEFLPRTLTVFQQDYNTSMTRHAKGTPEENKAKQKSLEERVRKQNEPNTGPYLIVYGLIALVIALIVISI